MSRVRLTYAKVVSTLALGVALATAGGFAYSAIPDPEGVVHGCANKTTGALRVIDLAAGRACNATTEDEFSWNQQGPKGDTGPKGTDGTTGPTRAADLVALAQGPAKSPIKPKGLSPKTRKRLATRPASATEAYSTSRKGSIAIFDGLKDLLPKQIVLNLALPRGRWVINAKTVVASRTLLGSPFVYCTLNAGADFDTGSGWRFNTFPLQLVHRFATSGAVQMRCGTFDVGTAELEHSRLTAVRVSKLTNKPG